MRPEREKTTDDRTRFDNRKAAAYPCRVDRLVRQVGVLVVWLRPGLQPATEHVSDPVQTVRSIRRELLGLRWRHTACLALRASAFLALDHSESVPIVRQAIRQA